MKKHTSLTRLNRKQLSEDGFAAIIVTMIVMAILVLITIGFVRIVGREQRASLDRQLSTQAFYAAETGVNDAAKLLADGVLTDEKTECSVDTASGWSPQLDDEVEYTCVLIDPQPPNLEFDGIGQQSPRVIRLNGVDGDGDAQPIDSIQISWQSDPYPDSPNLSAGNNFPPSLGNAAPVLRVALTPLHELSRQELIENTMTIFLRPTSDTGAGSTTYFSDITGSNPSDQGRVVAVECDLADTANPRICNHRIAGLNIGSVGTSGYLLTIRAVYSNASVFINGESSGTDELRFAEQQAIVDATGRASDVLRRIQVRLPLVDTFEYPGFALEAAAGICKPYSIQGSGQGSNTGDSLCALP